MEQRDDNRDDGCDHCDQSLNMGGEPQGDVPLHERRPILVEFNCARVQRIFRVSAFWKLAWTREHPWLGVFLQHRLRQEINTLGMQVTADQHPVHIGYKGHVGWWNILFNIQHTPWQCQPKCGCTPPPSQSSKGGHRDFSATPARPELLGHPESKQHQLCRLSMLQLRLSLQRARMLLLILKRQPSPKFFQPPVWWRFRLAQRRCVCPSVEADALLTGRKSKKPKRHYYKVFPRTAAQARVCHSRYPQR